ncbi:MAG: ATP-binding protein [Candidatus Omnitrophica bacterium]|nr:ATP-binding protein [Candidatus Omnitrophota bacterium]
MNPYNFSLLCFGFCTILLAILVFLKRNDHVGKHFLAFSLFCGGWALAIGVNFSDSASDSLALFSSRLGNALALFIPISWYQFVLTFVEKEYFFKYRIKVLYLLVLAVSLFSFTPWFIPNVRYIVGFRCCWPGPIFIISPLLFFFIIPLGFMELFKRIKVSEGQERKQLVGLAVATGVGFLGGGLTFFPVYNIPLPQYGLFITPIYAFALAYIMIKQKLFDISVLADAIQTAKLTALGVIAASINHEIRNPLFVIKGLAEILAERVVDPLADKEQVLAKAKEIADKTIAQSDRALGIIKSFSSYAKRETDKVYEKQRVRVKGVVEHILPFVESELSLKKITILQDIPEELEIFVDVQSLEEIFINLIVNACQAMPGGGEIEITAKTVIATLLLSCDSKTQGKQSLLITIRDTGPGLAQDQLNRIFEPFYTTKASGTGLGLYVVKQLVERNGGKVEVSSKEGVGTTFTFTFLAL